MLRRCRLGGVLAVLAGRGPAPGGRDIGRRQSTLRRVFGRGFFDDRFADGILGDAGADRSGLARRHRFAQRLVEDLRSGLRAVADRRRHLRADRTGVGLTSAEAAQISDRRRGGGDCLAGTDFIAGRIMLRGAERQQNQHQPEPECHAKQEKHIATPAVFLILLRLISRNQSLTNSRR